MSHLYNFGLSQEDERTEVAALALCPGERVLSIASAGDMPLSLLALGAGAVDAVDSDAAQLHLTRLKLAAVEALERVDAVAFLGFVPAPPKQRLRWLKEVLAVLPEGSRTFWEAAAARVSRGAIWAGRFERYMRWLAGTVVPLVGRRKFESLFACATLEEQALAFTRHFERSGMRALFRVAFHPKVFARRGMDPRSLEHRDRSVSLGEQYFATFRALCTGSLARDNPLLQLMVLRRTLSADVVPAYLSATGAEVVRTGRERLRLHLSDLGAYLEALPPGSFDKAHLSNLPDWLSQRRFEEVLALVAGRAARPARVVWRYIHVDRVLPPELEARVRVDRELGAHLRQQDRFPFYGIVPAELL